MIDRRARPSAFTLVELLVVMFLLALLAGLTFLLVPSINDQSRSPRGAVMLQQWLQIAKNNAMRDRTNWGVDLCKRVDSENFKLLYDIYHMQIMEGDVIRTIRDNHKYIAHYHTGGNPGRNEIDETQELNYAAITKAIVETGLLSGGSDLLPKWSSATFTVQMTCTSTAGAQTLSGIYTNTSGVAPPAVVIVPPMPAASFAMSTGRFVDSTATVPARP